MSRHKYKFTNKHNTIGGAAALLLGIIAAGLMIWALYMAYRDKGNSGTDMGIIGTLSFFVSTVGLILGLMSFKEEDKFYLLSYIGSVLCGIIWIMLIVVTFIGIYCL